MFKNFVFVQIGVVDAGNFKGADEVENLKRHIEEANQRYVDYMRQRGYYAEAVTAVGIDVVQKASELAPEILRTVSQRGSSSAASWSSARDLLHPPAAQLRRVSPCSAGSTSRACRC